MEGVKGEVAQAKWLIQVKGPKIQVNGLDLTSFGGTNLGSHWLVKLLKCGVSACRSLLRIKVIQGPGIPCSLPAGQGQSEMWGHRPNCCKIHSDANEEIKDANLLQHILKLLYEYSTMNLLKIPLRSLALRVPRVGSQAPSSAHRTCPVLS